jgi:hypothetical protein
MKRAKTSFRTTASGAPLALQDFFKVANTHVRQMSFARSSSFNSSILLWKDNKSLPEVPFAVGIWYQQSQELFPIGVVTSLPDEPISVGQFEKSQQRSFATLSDITSFILNRIASFEMPSMRINNAKEDKLARAAMWSLCHPDNYHILAKLELRKEESFKLGEAPVRNYPPNANTPVELRPFAEWLNAWIDAHG